MKALSIVLSVFALALAASSFYVVDSGNVAVEKTMGTVDMNETNPGLNWKLPILTRAYEFSSKEIVIDFNDLTPKARDNLRLKDLDVSIYYKVAPEKIAEMMVKFKARTA
ncbi:MAG TPA: hypothetical protein DCF62_04950, partial [Porticoccaceae bacterium]|nr:hypothetical protein [Porticoccaceae bacterium]